MNLQDLEFRKNSSCQIFDIIIKYQEVKFWMETRLQVLPPHPLHTHKGKRLMNKAQLITELRDESVTTAMAQARRQTPEIVLTTWL